MKLWIARDKCGYSQLYCERPLKKDGYFEAVPNTGWYTISHRLFQNVTFENSPQEIEITLLKDTDK